MYMNKNLWKRLCAVVLCFCLLTTITGCSPESKYTKANKLLAEGNYAKAAEQFESLGSFEDAPMLTMYAKAAAAGEAGQFDACLQAFETLGDFKDSPLMVNYYTARAYEAAGLAAQAPQHQKEQESWVALMNAAELYGQLLLFRDSQQRQQACYQAVYGMAEGLATAELFDAARDAHYSLAYIQYQDSNNLGKYYAARAHEVSAPRGVTYDSQWAVEDFDKFQKAISIFDDYSHVRDSQTRAENCRQTVYAFAKECAAHADYSSASAIIGYVSGYLDADQLAIYYSACHQEQQGQYEAAAQTFDMLGDYTPEGNIAGTIRAKTARQTAYAIAITMLEEGHYEDGYALLRTLGDYNGATAYVPQHEMQRAKAHMTAGEYLDAIELFELIIVHVESEDKPEYTPELGSIATERMKAAYYYYGETLFANAKDDVDYFRAKNAFQKAGDYTPPNRDIIATQRYQSLWYEKGEALLAYITPDYEGAKKAFAHAGNYAPKGMLSGNDRSYELWYKEGEALFTSATTSEDYAKAANAFQQAANYTPNDGISAKNRYASLWYEKGELLFTQIEPDYIGAWAAFVYAGDYTPNGGICAAARAKEAMYQNGEASLINGQYGNALLAYRTVGNYESAPQKAMTLTKAFRGVVEINDEHMVCIQRDGTVIAAGDNSHGECNVDSWTDIIMISTSLDHTVGLKNDGTVVAVGKNDQGQCDVHEWKDIVAIEAGTDCTIGIMEDGTVVFAGSNNDLSWAHNWHDVVAIDTVSGYSLIDWKNIGPNTIYVKKLLSEIE